MRAQKLSEWRKLPLSLTELCIDTTLRCGQSFRWRKLSDEWYCVLQGRLVSLKQDDSHLHYRVTWPKSTTKPLTPPASVPPPSPAPPLAKVDDTDEDDTASLLNRYFALSLPVSSLYQQWAESDANFARRAPAFTGIRILNQDAWEALVAFICSSNNNILRISQMVQKLCLHYGPYVGTVEGEPFHDFPGPDALAGDGVEAHLRELGFGYRAKYIASTARIVSRERPPDWLLRLRNPECPAFNGAVAKAGSPQETDTGQQPTYRAAHDALLELAGVGPKVADCVCLMGLGWGEAVPIDTHVWQIAQRDYKFGGGKAGKTFTKTMYDAVGDHFRKIWGPYAGWAQSVLFTANLKSFAEQASGVKVKVKAEGEALHVVKTEVTVSESRSDDAEVKVEESDEAAAAGEKDTVSRTRKRKATAAVARVSAGGVVAVKSEETEVSTRRTSKRIRASASR